MQMVYKILITIILITIVLALFIGYKLSIPNSELNKMKTEEIETYFKTNKKELKHLVEICDKYSEIGFVDDTNVNELIMYYEENLSTETRSKIKEIQNINKTIKIFSMECERSSMVIDNKLMGVSFVLYSYGLSLGGESQSIGFETKEYLDSLKNHKKIDIANMKVYPLSEEGWSIIFLK